MTEAQSWNKYVAELLGTFVLVFVGTAAIVASGGNYLAIAFAFGLALTAGIYTFGQVSGGHFNPAVTIAMWVNKRIEMKDAVPYIVCQVIGAIVASAFVFGIWATNGTPTTAITAAIGTTTTASSVGLGVTAVLLAEIVFTMVFVWTILGVTSRNANPQWTGLLIGLTLAGIHLAALGISGASVNPARSTGPALFAQGAALTNLWAYWVGPIVGAVVGAVVYRVVVPETVTLVNKRSMEIPA